MYMNLHPACEACGVIESQEYHHIVTRATKGPSEDWNALALCRACHTTWHTEGRKRFTVRYPRVEAKVMAAVKRMGRKW